MILNIISSSSNNISTSTSSINSSSGTLQHLGLLPISLFLHVPVPVQTLALALALEAHSLVHSLTPLARAEVVGLVLEQGRAPSMEYLHRSPLRLRSVTSP